VSCLRNHDDDTTDTHSEAQSTRTPQTTVRGHKHIPMKHRYHVLGQRGARGGTSNMSTSWSRETKVCLTQTAHVKTRTQQQRGTKACERVVMSCDTTAALRHSRLHGFSVSGSAYGGCITPLMRVEKCVSVHPLRGTLGPTARSNTNM
jgi:hypothetical protein